MILCSINLPLAETLLMGLKGQAGVYEGKKLLLVHADTILGIPEHQRIWLDSK